MNLSSSLFEEDDHGIANIETNIASIVVSYGVATLLDDEAVPIALVLPIKLLLDFTRDVREVVDLVRLKGLQSRDHSVLYFVLGHVGPLDQDALVGLATEVLKHILVIAGYDRDRGAIFARDPEREQPSRSNINHCSKTFS